MSRYGFPNPPSSVTGELGNYLRQIKRRFDAIPTISYFSGTYPSQITGLASDIVVNVGVSSSASRLFINYGSPTIPNTSWRTIA